MDDKLVETVARAMCLAVSRNPMERRTVGDDVLWEWELRTPAARAAIQAHITYMEENGLVVVPREPTEAMKEAWGKGWTHNMDCGGATNDWRNMISAAQKEQG